MAQIIAKGQSSSTELLTKLSISLLRDVQTLHSGVISPESLRRDAQKVVSRVAMEGHGFLTKALPRLGKALDRALSGVSRLEAEPLGFKTRENSVLPLLLGELFERVFTNDGWVRPDPCVSSIKSLRQFLYTLYKYELPYDTETEAAVLLQFERTEEEVTRWSRFFDSISQTLESTNDARVYSRINYSTFPHASLIKKARRVLHALFKYFDPHDIVPSHGPGAVSTGERLSEKWEFTKVSQRLVDYYPLDAYFFASLSHVCDRPEQLAAIEVGEDSAKVVLVPKDSRGPRLISCEPLSNQWIQQGLMRAIIRHVESHPLTEDAVHFTNQQPNQFGALLGSKTGKYATLDLNEASDRITVGLVKLLFPGNVVDALLASRSLTTKLPDGRILNLSKFAPMGSATCFPTLALTVWSLLFVGAPDADTREGILVYGDDVVVPSGYAAHATVILEAFGLKVNRDKSYSTGFFRESCGRDAYKGVEVTPVRIRTVWTSSRSPEALASWCSYANSFYQRSFFYTYELIAGELFRVYGKIPEVTQGLSCPSLMEVPESLRPKPRWNKGLQRLEFRCWSLVPRAVEAPIDGWSMLHRYFVASHATTLNEESLDSITRLRDFCLGLSALSTDSTGGRRAHTMGFRFLQFEKRPFSVCSYTKPRDTKLVSRWLGGNIHYTGRRWECYHERDGTQPRWLLSGAVETA